MPIVTVDSVTTLGPQHCDSVVVAGSHGGVIAGLLAAKAQVRAVILNDAGVGKDQAGIASLRMLESIGMAAATVDRRTAPMGQGQMALHAGVVSHVNQFASTCGVRVGDMCLDAAYKLHYAPLPFGTLPHGMERRGSLDDAENPAVIGCDSVCLVQPEDEGQILVIGSHSALHAPDPRSALSVDAVAAFFHDAGSYGEAAGISRLPVLDARGIAAAAVDHRTARIGDARSMWESGRLSFINTTAHDMGLRKGMTLPRAVACVRSAWVPASAVSDYATL